MSTFHLTASLSGVFADLPAVTDVAIGATYQITDQGNRVVRSDGTNWVAHGGDVTGPGAAVTTARIATWNGTSGRSIQDGGATIAGVLATADAAAATRDAAIKLDDLAAPDDNTDLNASTSKHGLLRK